jgi:hypothetical protein
MCREIDDETIELYILDRLENRFVRNHLKTCLICQARVNEYRYYMDVLRSTLRNLGSKRPSHA